MRCSAAFERISLLDHSVWIPVKADCARKSLEIVSFLLGIQSRDERCLGAEKVVVDRLLSDIEASASEETEVAFDRRKGTVLKIDCRHSVCSRGLET